MLLANALRGLHQRWTERRPASARPNQRRTLELSIETLEERSLLSYTHTLIADSTVGALGVLPTITSGGDVALVARLPGTGGDAVLTGDGGPFTVLRLPAYPGDNIVAGIPVNGAGTAVAYTARPEPGADPAVYIATGWPSPATLIADTSGEFSNVSFLPHVNDAGTVVFFAELRAGGTVIMQVNAKGYTPLYGTGIGPFDEVLELGNFNNADTIVFRAVLKGVEGFFTGTGGDPTTIVTIGGDISGLHGRGFLNDAGTVVFLANMKDESRAIMTGDGKKLTTVVTTGGDYSAIGQGAQSGVSINNAGQVAFAATRTEGGLRGIFTGPDDVGDKVVGVGDELFGSTVMTVGLANRSLNDAGQIAYTATLANGRRVIVRADPARGGSAPDGSTSSGLQPMPDFVSLLTIDPGQPLHTEAGSTITPNGLGGGLFNSDRSQTTISASMITENEAGGGAAGTGGKAGQGIGVVCITDGCLVCVDDLSFLGKNRASTSHDDVFGEFC